LPLFRAVLEVVVVVVQLGVGVGFTGELEGEWEEGLADGVVKDGLAISAIFVERWGEEG
jgi:hypothetical protein